MSTIFIGSDHAGFECKKVIFNHLKKLADTDYTNIDYIEDVGCYSESAVDYPDIAKELCNSMKPYFTTGITRAYGVLICGTGEGMCMVANKYEGCRAGVAWKPEIAKAIREHNNANVICLPAR